MLAHGSVLVDQFLDPETLRAVVEDERTAGLDATDVAVMELADKVAEDATRLNRSRLRPPAVARSSPTKDILDVVLAAAARCFFSKVLDGVGAEPDAKYQALDPGLRDTLTVGRPIARP